MRVSWDANNVSYVAVNDEVADTKTHNETPHIKAHKGKEAKNLNNVSAQQPIQDHPDPATDFSGMLEDFYITGAKNISMIIII